MRKLMRYSDGLLPNLLVLVYVVGGYCASWLMLLKQNPLLWLLGVVWLAHTMVIAAYMIHECAHNTIFLSNRHNARLGEFLSWLTGSSYGQYEDIRHKHFRHHVDRADVVAFDYRPILARYPRVVRVMQWLEWCYIPAVQLMMHALVVVLPFIMPNRARRRARVITVLLLRGSLFLWIGLVAPFALLGYAVAYMLFLNVMRFMDTHQHTYEIFATLEQPRGAEAKKFDQAYEHRNTFSNLISIQHPWLNLLVLNFGFHNAHHAKPTTTWHRLPALHRELYGDDASQLLPFANLIRAFHRYRVTRILNEDEADLDVMRDKGASFIGVDGVSFLTAH